MTDTKTTIARLRSFSDRLDSMTPKTREMWNQRYHELRLAHGLVKAIAQVEEEIEGMPL